ncbi:MAG: hypothetical protein O7D33_02185 [Chloroflexi bacterium]|nr:hypothetical protein [Chloroflexota bacterium]
MIIDFSFRPPYRSLGEMEVYKRRPEDTFAVKIGMTPSPAATQNSMDLLLKEMEEAEIVHGVCHGRARDGTKTQDLLDIMKEYPGKFTSFAGSDLTDMRQAVETTKHCLDNLGFIGIMLEPGMRMPPSILMTPRYIPSTRYAGSGRPRAVHPQRSGRLRHLSQPPSPFGPRGRRLP